MTVEALAPGTKAVRRRRALEPYLLKVQEVLRSDQRDWSRPHKLAVDGVALAIEPWVVACVGSRGTEPDDNAGPAEMLRQCLALWLKSALDVRALRRQMQSGSANLYELQANLMQDSAFGTTLLQELQTCVDQLVKQGELEEAKRFSKFRFQVTCVVREVKRSIQESNGPPEAEIDEPEIASAVTPRPVAKAVLTEPDPVYQPPRRRPRPAQTKPGPAAAPAAPTPGYRTQILVALDVAALVAWIVLGGPAQLRDKPLRALTVRDFAGATPLAELVARPPALYATVDEKTWSGFDSNQQKHFVDALGIVLHSHGYGGLALKTTDGRLVGEWLENGGTRLLKADPAAPVAKRPAATGQYSRFVP